MEAPSPSPHEQIPPKQDQPQIDKTDPEYLEFVEAYYLVKADFHAKRVCKELQSARSAEQPIGHASATNILEEAQELVKAIELFRMNLRRNGGAWRGLF